MQQPADNRKPECDDAPGAAALYIASLTDELAQLAKRNGLEALSYLLEMARLEADQVCQDSVRPRNYPQSIPPRGAN